MAKERTNEDPKPWTPDLQSMLSLAVRLESSQLATQFYRVWLSLQQLREHRFSIFLDMLEAGFNQQLHHEYSKKAVAELVHMKIHVIPHSLHCPICNLLKKDVANNNL